uniref:Glycosyltransferase n=1 Tax=Linum usitatissimum TaxID=4006 RepID=I2BH79_LINUS|nr:UDP-glycosyltransferase 1 [Linum usitatissimum]
MADGKIRATTKPHVAMFPWFAFGHITPYLHLANHLASRGHRVSFLIPKRTQSKFTKLNRHPHLITFHPITVPHVDGLPPGAETSYDAPFPLVMFLFTAFDRTQPQVREILTELNPSLVLYDLAHWIPSLGLELGFKKVAYVTASAVSSALRILPSVKMVKGMTDAELMRPPPGYPSSVVVPRLDEVDQARFLAEDFGGSAVPFYERLTASNSGGDAIAFRTCRELEGQFCDYLGQQYGKPILLTGPILPDEDKTPMTAEDEKLFSWLGNFDGGSVVYCAFGSEIALGKDQFQELLNGFELCGLPFLAALKPPAGCSTVEEAFPEGFEDKVRGRGWVTGGWVPQQRILDHASVGCFVSHCGFGSMWEGLLSKCQLVMAPTLGDQIMGTMLMVNELKVAVEVEKIKSGDRWWIAKEKLSEAIRAVMDGDGEVGGEVRRNHLKFREVLGEKKVHDKYVDDFVVQIHDLLDA